MNAFFVIADQRKGPSRVIATCKSFEKAKEKLREYVQKKYTKEAIQYCTITFGSDLNKGKFYSEEESIEISEEEIEE